MNDGWQALDEMQGQEKSEEEVLEDVSISPGALGSRNNPAKKRTNFSRTREQSAREWVQQNQVELDSDGFDKGMGDSDVISEYLSNTGEDADIDYEDSGALSAKVTQEGVASVAQDLYEQDLVTVETPEMDASGVSGRINISVDENRIGDYLEEIQDEFAASGDPKASASAAVALGTEAIFQAIEENYDGDVEVNTYSSGAPHRDIPSSDKPSFDSEYGGTVVKEASYIPEAGEAALETYEENVQEAEIKRQRAEEEDDGGLLERFL